VNYLKNKPYGFFINKIEKENTDFKKVLDELRDSIKGHPVALSIPIGEGTEFKGIVDLIKMKAYLYDQPGKGKEADIPANIDAKSYREQLVEAAAESDDSLMEKFFEEGVLSDEELLQGLKKGVKSETSDRYLLVLLMKIKVLTSFKWYGLFSHPPLDVFEQES
jgi:elongation factor G